MFTGMLKRKKFTLILILIFIVSILNVYGKTVEIWSGRKAGPYVLDQSKKTGLTYDFIDYLNEDLKRKNLGFDFVVRDMPRKRMKVKMAKGEDAIVIWVMEKWFDDAKLEKYNWTRPILLDKNIIISNSKNKIEYTGLESLINRDKKLILGGILGYRYVQIDDLVAKGLIKRDDTSSKVSNFGKLSRGRVDFLIIAFIEYKYIIKNFPINVFYVGEKAQQEFGRKFLVTKGLGQVHKYLNNKLKQIYNEEKWKQILKKYNINANEVRPM